MSTNIEFISVFLGESRTIPVRIQTKDCQPFDLTGATEIQARFRNKNGLTLIKTLTNEGTLTGGVSIIGLPTAGRLTIDLLPADTQELKVGERQNFTLVIFKGNRAQVTVAGVVFKAKEPGVLLNGVQLSFDGVMTAQEVVDAYNALNQPEREIYLVGTGSVVAPVQTATLTGGTDNKRIVNYDRSISVYKPSV